MNREGEGIRMAAYAALVSLMNTIDNIHNHSRLSTSLDKNQVESLGEKLDFILHFVESYNNIPGGISKEEVEDLERHIVSTAHAAEDVIESHIVDSIGPHMGKETSSSLLLDLLANIMVAIENHPHLSTSDIDMKQIESMDEKIDFLLDFIETMYNSDGGMSKEESEDLACQIETEALAFQDEMESFGKSTPDYGEEYSSTFFKTLLDQLIFCMELILNHPRFLICIDQMEVIESLDEGLGMVIGLTEGIYKSAGGGSKEEAEGQLESQIASEDAGSTFEHGETSSGFMLNLQREIKTMKKKVLKVLQKIRGKEATFGVSENSFLLDLQIILEEMDSVKKKVIKVQEEMGFKDERPTNSMAASSSMPPTTGKTTAVGFDSYEVQLLDWLTGQESRRQIIPITGMGGLGKTTLAKKVYENLFIEQHFYVRAWVTVSQEYNVRDILFQILSCLVESTMELENKTEGELGVELHKVLCGRRYLIILDDVWSIEAWDKIRIFFPENKNGSRIVVTTRQSDMANHFGSMGLALSFLEDDISWDLFCMKAFAQGCCPPELENIGRNIVKKCNGLPLSIVVIGGLLRKASRTLEFWKNVEKDLTTILNSAEDNHCLNILSLSYSHLPVHLKPCFLYLGIFSEDQEIDVSRLIKLWIAEGFLKPNKEKSLEEIAKGYIRDLADRNLVLVRRLSLNGKVRTCSIHDLLRDLCIKVAEKEKLICMIRVRDPPRTIDRECRIITLESIVKESHSPSFHTFESTSLARSVISDVSWNLSLKSRLLRVLSNAYGDSHSLVTAFEQVNLRFLEYTLRSEVVEYKIPSSISLLWNLQTLIIEGYGTTVVAPFEIWEMQRLRHLEFFRVRLCRPPLSDEQGRVVLKDLHTLGVAYLFKFSDEVCQRMPNIKKLSIYLPGDYLGLLVMSASCFYNIGRLNKLESLNFNFKEPCRDEFLKNLKLPSSLRKLTLRNGGLHWDDLILIGSLPHLEVLKLQDGAVGGSIWNPVEGDFLRLKYLEITGCDLRQWNAYSCHFPILEKLELNRLWKLEEISTGMGEIATLRDISLDYCSISSVISAIKILEEQESLGNQDLQVRVRCWDEESRKEAMEKVQLQAFSCHNFIIS